MTKVEGITCIGDSAVAPAGADGAKMMRDITSPVL
jgi:hypothetical protein